jgi:arylformamidase
VARVLVTEQIDPVGIELLKANGHTVIQMQTRERSELLQKAADADAILGNATRCNAEASRSILIKGKATVTEEAAGFFADKGLLLLGNESQTVGPEDAPMQVHKILLGAGTVLLEGIRLEQVPDGVYLLFAAPLCLGGADGAPCRAVLATI